MNDLTGVINAWNRADPNAIHPARGLSESAYRESGQVQAELLAQVLPESGIVVDFGCGDGRVAIPLKRLGYTVVAVDGSPNMLDRVTAAMADIPVLMSDGTDLAKRLIRKADAVISLAVLIHHNYESAERIIAGLMGTFENGQGRSSPHSLRCSTEWGISTSVARIVCRGLPLVECARRVEP